MTFILSVSILCAVFSISGSTYAQPFQVHGLARGMSEDRIQNAFAIAKHPAQKASSLIYEAYDTLFNDVGDFTVLVGDSQITRIGFSSAHHSLDANKYLLAALAALIDLYGEPVIDSMVVPDESAQSAAAALGNFGHLGPPSRDVRIIRWYREDEKLEVIEHPGYYNIFIRRLQKE
jgi:hypothetical protein